jgi:hypothetical protein
MNALGRVRESRLSEWEAASGTAGTTIQPTRRQCLRSSLVVARAARIGGVLGTLSIVASRSVVVRPVGQRRGVWLHRLAV